MLWFHKYGRAIHCYMLSPEKRITDKQCISQKTWKEGSVRGLLNQFFGPRYNLCTRKGEMSRTCIWFSETVQWFIIMLMQCRQLLLKDTSYIDVCVAIATFVFLLYSIFCWNAYVPVMNLWKNIFACISLSVRESDRNGTTHNSSSNQERNYP